MAKQGGKGKRNAAKAGKEPDGTRLKSENDWGEGRTAKRKGTENGERRQKKD